MGCFEVMLTVGNIQTMEQVETIAKGLVRIAERDLGSRSVKPVKAN